MIEVNDILPLQEGIEEALHQAAYFLLDSGRSYEMVVFFGSPLVGRARQRLQEIIAESFTKGLSLQSKHYPHHAVTPKPVTTFPYTINNGESYGFLRDYLKKLGAGSANPLLLVEDPLRSLKDYTAVSGAYTLDIGYLSRKA